MICMDPNDKPYAVVLSSMDTSSTIKNSFPRMFARRLSVEIFVDLLSQSSFFGRLMGRAAQEWRVEAPISTAATPVVAHLASMSSFP